MTALDCGGMCTVVGPGRCSVLETRDVIYDVTQWLRSTMCSVIKLSKLTVTISHNILPQVTLINGHVKFLKYITVFV